MVMDKESLVLKVLESINTFIKIFQENPYLFLYESDIQCRLFGILRENIDAKLHIPIKQEEVRKFRWNNKLNPLTRKKEYVIHHINSEYFISKKIDLVCIAPLKNFANIKYEFKSSGAPLFEMPLLVGIELKYIFLGETPGSFENCFQDFTKLKILKNKGLCEKALVLCFLQERENELYFLENAYGYGEFDTLDESVIKDAEGIYIIGSKEFGVKKTVLSPEKEVEEAIRLSRRTTCS